MCVCKSYLDFHTGNIFVRLCIEFVHDHIVGIGGMVCGEFPLWEGQL